MRCNKDSTYLWGLLLWYWIPESHSAHWIPVKMRPLLCREKDTPGYCKYWCFLRTPLESLERSLNSLPLEYPEVENVLWHTMISSVFLSCIPRRTIPVHIRLLFLGKRGTLFSEEQEGYRVYRDYWL